jgi:hypothetical protein
VAEGARDADSLLAGWRLYEPKDERNKLVLWYAGLLQRNNKVYRRRAGLPGPPKTQFENVSFARLLGTPAHALAPRSHGTFKSAFARAKLGSLGDNDCDIDDHYNDYHYPYDDYDDDYWIMIIIFRIFLSVHEDVTPRLSGWDPAF